MEQRKFNKLVGKIEKILMDLPQGNAVDVNGLTKTEALELKSHYTDLIYATKVHPNINVSASSVNETYVVQIWRSA